MRIAAKPSLNPSLTNRLLSSRRLRRDGALAPSGLSPILEPIAERRIAERAKASAEESYTRKLLDKGAAHCVKKFGEEAVEAVMAVAGEDRDRVIAESADVFPGGRYPTSFGSAETDPRLGQRRFSSSTASLMAA